MSPSINRTLFAKTATRSTGLAYSTSMPTAVGNCSAAGRRQTFISMQIINQNEYTWPADLQFAAAHHHEEQLGTRYVLLGFRDSGRPERSEGPTASASLARRNQGRAGPGSRAAAADRDPVSQKKIRDALLALATTVNDTSRAFGTKERFDPVQRLIGAACAWGANPLKTPRLPLNVVPAKNGWHHGLQAHRSGCACQQLVGSVSRYNVQGFTEERVRCLHDQRSYGKEKR